MRKYKNKKIFLIAFSVFLFLAVSAYYFKQKNIEVAIEPSLESDASTAVKRPAKLIAWGGGFDYMDFLSDKTSQRGIDRINAVQDSPFDGFTVSLNEDRSGQKESCSEDPEAVDLEPYKAALKEYNTNHKEFWPKIRIQTMLDCFDPSGPIDSQYVSARNSQKACPADPGCMKGSWGMDIYNSEGKRAKFMDGLRGALRLARNTDAGGIFIDFEPYINYETYKINYLADKVKNNGKYRTVSDRKQLIENVKKDLQSVGASMANKINSVYPEASIWVYAFDMDCADPNDAQNQGNASNQIVLGMMRQAQAKRYKFKVIDSGSGKYGNDDSQIAYLHPNLEVLKQRVANHKKAFQACKKIYNNFQFGAAFGIYPNIHMLGENWQKHFLNLWMNKNHYKCPSVDKCPQMTVRKVEDFRPLLNYLFGQFDYVWNYSGPDSTNFCIDQAAKAPEKTVEKGNTDFTSCPTLGKTHYERYMDWDPTSSRIFRPVIANARSATQ